MDLLNPVRLILKEREQHPVWHVSPESCVYDAIALMAEKFVGALLVSENGKLVGVVSERDYARKIILQGRSSRDTLVREIMTSPAISVTPEQTVEDCMRIMTEKHIRHLPVAREGEILGIVSIGDLVKWIISAQQETISELHNYISNKYPA